MTHLDKQISVFGGTGFVGSEFVRQNEGKCFVVPRERRTSPTNDILYLISTVDNYNVHTNLFLDVHTNLVILLDVLNHAKTRYGNDFTFNFVSSWFTYGTTEQPAKETSPCNPRGFYSITKRAAEQLLISYCETFDINYRIFRLPNVLGLGDKKVSAKKNALQFLIKEMILGNPIKLYYGGNFYRDYMDVRDVADAMRFLMSREDALNQIYNICGITSSTHFGDAFYWCYEIIRSKSEITNVEEVEFHKNVQVKSMKMDYSKLSNLGWEPKHFGRSILFRIIEGYELELHPSR